MARRLRGRRGRRSCIVLAKSAGSEPVRWCGHEELEPLVQYIRSRLPGTYNLILMRLLFFFWTVTLFEIRVLSSNFHADNSEASART